MSSRTSPNIGKIRKQFRNSNQFIAPEDCKSQGDAIQSTRQPTLYSSSGTGIGFWIDLNNVQDDESGPEDIEDAKYGKCTFHAIVKNGDDSSPDDVEEDNNHSDAEDKRIMKLFCAQFNFDNSEFFRDRMQFDLGEYLEFLERGVDALSCPFNSIWERIDVAFTKSRVKVSPKLGMRRTGVMPAQYGWEGEFTITNQTGLNITYMVNASQILIYIRSKIGWIGPKASKTITVYCHDLNNIKDLFNHGIITVQIVPVFFKTHLEQKVLKSYWNNCSSPSPLFTSSALEIHTIENIYSMQYDLMDNWSLLNDGIYIGQRTLFGKAKEAKITEQIIDQTVEETLIVKADTEMEQCVINYEMERIRQNKKKTELELESESSQKRRLRLVWRTLFIFIALFLCMLQVQIAVDSLAKKGMKCDKSTKSGWSSYHKCQK